MSKRIEITNNERPMESGGYIVAEIDEDAHQGVMTVIKTRLDNIEEVLGAVRFILSRGRNALLVEPMMTPVPALEEGEEDE